ncbi:unnamed protein product [Miscanthus lutarioriparius]|uniref:Class II aldolase/adducin N-terminal domain-containing protein n=1 Tax=Miscanthus lutarioriparius TaxID=422564 RepID=A0A811Q6U1_9POAL|nr:unnamed protein product [Miscanthus lutarioriparius]
MACGETSRSEAYLAGPAVREVRELVAELCRHFYAPGWVTGTGGSITVKRCVRLAGQLGLGWPAHSHFHCSREQCFQTEEYFLSQQSAGTIFWLIFQSCRTDPRSTTPTCRSPTASSWCAKGENGGRGHAYLMRGAGAVIHSHGIETCLASMLDPGAKEFRNTPYEYELTDSLSEAIAAYPKTTAVLVRNHGIFVWGDSWISAKTQAESYHYLLDAAIKLYHLGIDWTTPEHGPIAKKPRRILSPGISNGGHAAESPTQCVVLDIEGTTTPISFVTDVMFPYARDNIEDDLSNRILGAVPVPPDEAGIEEVIDSLVSNVESMIKADRKITSLKQLQGHIWRTGFEKKEIQGVIFEDVPEAQKNWHSRNINVSFCSHTHVNCISPIVMILRSLEDNHCQEDGRTKSAWRGTRVFRGIVTSTGFTSKEVYIYSSGSREAQRLLFGNTMYGDLRKFLCGYFDTTIGFEVVISIHQGNAPVPENNGFRTIKSFSEI